LGEGMSCPLLVRAGWAHLLLERLEEGLFLGGQRGRVCFGLPPALTNIFDNFVEHLFRYHASCAYAGEGRNRARCSVDNRASQAAYGGRVYCARQMMYFDSI
jgi:hypothetical protein